LPTHARRVGAAGRARGAARALAGGRLLQGFVFGIAVADPPTYVAAAGLVLTVAAAACARPAWHAARADPLLALRAE
jgi:putative ABC transport system permease protein